MKFVEAQQNEVQYANLLPSSNPFAQNRLFVLILRSMSEREYIQRKVVVIFRYSQQRLTKDLPFAILI